MPLTKDAVCIRSSRCDSARPHHSHVAPLHAKAEHHIGYAGAA